MTDTNVIDECPGCGGLPHPDASGSHDPCSYHFGVAPIEVELALFNEPVDPALADAVRNTWERCKHTTQALNALALALAYYGDDEGSELLKVFARRFATHEAAVI